MKYFESMMSRVDLEDLLTARLKEQNRVMDTSSMGRAQLSRELEKLDARARRRQQHRQPATA